MLIASLAGEKKVAGFILLRT